MLWCVCVTLINSLGILKVKTEILSWQVGSLIYKSKFPFGFRTEVLTSNISKCETGQTISRRECCWPGTWRTGEAMLKQHGCTEPRQPPSWRSKWHNSKLVSLLCLTIAIRRQDRCQRPGRGRAAGAPYLWSPLYSRLENTVSMFLLLCVNRGTRIQVSKYKVAQDTSSYGFPQGTQEETLKP